MMKTLPAQFCWTRFGTEAAQTIDQIISRKEQERSANSGMFLWGIGNAIGPSMKELIRLTPNPEVLFSPIKGKPRAADANPPAVVAWTSARGIFDDDFVIPKHSLVTSRFDPTNPRSAHYALVCHSDEPLILRDSSERLDADLLRNLLTGRSVGASQVTAVVDQMRSEQAPSSTYGVALRARLVSPYLVKLFDPFPIPRIDSNSHNDLEWAEIIHRLLSNRPTANGGQLAFELALR